MCTLLLSSPLLPPTSLPTSLSPVLSCCMCRQTPDKYIGYIDRKIGRQSTPDSIREKTCTVLFFSPTLTGEDSVLFVSLPSFRPFPSLS